MNAVAPKPAPKVKAAEFKRREGYHINNADALVLGQRFLELAGDGTVDPPQIVEDARDPSSPLHRFFEWNDKRAAELQRLERARYLIGAVEISITYEGDTRERVKAFHSVTMDGERGYAHMGTVFGQKALTKQVIDQARRELQAWTQRYERYESLGGAVRAVRAAMTKLTAEE